MGTYSFDLKTIRYNVKQSGSIIKAQAIMIVIRNNVTDEIFPHPITHFLYKFYNRNSGSINTEKAAANVIVPFLNFVLNNVSEGKKNFLFLKGIADLRLEHANLFLKYCVEEKENSVETLTRKENYISKLYKYLSDQGVLKDKPVFDLVTILRDDKIIEVYKMNYSYKKLDITKVHKKVKRKDLVPQSNELSVNKQIIRLYYIREILLLAKQETPDIAFAIALEIFGGLRRGGAINLIRTALKPQNNCKYGEEGLIVEIRDRQEYLFNRFDDNSNKQVKNPRDQSCLIDPILTYLYKYHMEVVLKKVKSVKITNALFYDRNGNPMSSETFDKRFLKLKSTYLGMLLGTKGRYQDYLDFSQTRWRSHIGRGAFTNMCLDAGYNEKQTAVLRGDKSTKSMEDYFEVISATYNIQKALSLLSPENSHSISGLNMPFYNKSWREVEEAGRKF